MKQEKPAKNPRCNKCLKDVPIKNLYDHMVICHGIDKDYYDNERPNSIFRTYP